MRRADQKVVLRTEAWEGGSEAADLTLNLTPWPLEKGEVLTGPAGAPGMDGSGDLSVARMQASEQKTWLPGSTPLTWLVVQQDLLRRAVYGRQKRCYIVPRSQMMRERC